MPSLVIRLDPAKLPHATADLRYEIPARLEARAGGLIAEDGYDYEPDGDAMQIYLRTSELGRALPIVVALLETERFDGDDLRPAARVGVSDDDAVDTRVFRIVYPPGVKGTIATPLPALRLPVPAELDGIEASLGFRFPAAFRAFAAAPPPAFRRMFPHGRLVAHAKEVAALRRSLQSPRLVPFLIDPQAGHRDYYCFDLDTPGPDHGIAVFSVHTTVADWPNLAAWLTWLETARVAP